MSRRTERIAEQIQSEVAHAAARGGDRPAHRARHDHARRRGARSLARARLLERARERRSGRARAHRSGLDSAAPFLRRRLAHELPLRRMPELRFRFDPSLALGSETLARADASSRTMSRRRPELPGAAGFLVVDKPRGWTSHDVVDAARRWLGTRRVGHLGTLDPLATGVLPLAVREATKLVPFLATATKAYTGEIELGAETDTLDAEGRVLRRTQGALPERGRAARRARGLRGRDRAGAADVQRGQARRRAAAPAGPRGPRGRARAQEGPHRRAHAARVRPAARAHRGAAARPAPTCAASPPTSARALGCGAFLAVAAPHAQRPLPDRGRGAGGGARGAGAHGAARGEVDPPRQRARTAGGPARGAGRAPRAQRQRRDARGRGAASRGAGRRAWGPEASWSRSSRSGPGGACSRCGSCDSLAGPG